MACGTPVLAFRRGSVAEVIDGRVAGRLVDTVDEAIQRLPEVLRLDRRAIRRHFEERFSASRMAGDYVDVYTDLRRRAAASMVRRDRPAGSKVITLPRKKGVEHYAG